MLSQFRKDYPKVADQDTGLDSRKICGLPESQFPQMEKRYYPIHRSM